MYWEDACTYRNTDNSVHTTLPLHAAHDEAEDTGCCILSCASLGISQKKVQQKRNIKATRKSESINYIFNPARHKKMCLVSSFYMCAKSRPQVAPTPLLPVKGFVCVYFAATARCVGLARVYNRKIATHTERVRSPFLKFYPQYIYSTIETHTN